MANERMLGVALPSLVKALVSGEAFPASLRDALQARGIAGYQVYACGAPAMIDAARASFTAERALPPEEFFADSFTFAAASETTG